jgi:hypothetical protein
MTASAVAGLGVAGRLNLRKNPNCAPTLDDVEERARRRRRSAELFRGNLLASQPTT